MLALRYGFKNFEHEAPSTNRMCSKFKEANDFPSGKKVKMTRKWRSWNWQESDVHEIGKKVTYQRITLWTSKMNLTSEQWDNALSSLRTAQAGKSETRRNEKRYYKIQKGFICQ